MPEKKLNRKDVKNIKKIIYYLWEDEMKHFCEVSEFEIQSQDDLTPWIEAAEKSENESVKSHIFVTLMKLSKKLETL